MMQDQIPVISAVDRRARLDEVADAFGRAWLEGDWDSYFALWAADFIFEYPTAPFTGRWTGADAVSYRNAWRERSQNSRRTTIGEDLRLHDGPWVVACNHSQGIVQGKPHRGPLSTVLHRINDQGNIVEYREFLGGLT